MKKPWDDKTGLAKIAAVLATIFGISLGLCGANVIAFFGFAPLDDAKFRFLGPLLSTLGYLELATMVLSVAGLLLVAIIAAARGAGKVYSGRTGKSEED